jgi:hypothetical protein
MEQLTIEGVLKLFAESDRHFEERLEKQRLEFQAQLEQRRLEAEKQAEQRRLEAEKQAEQRRLENEKKRIEAEKEQKKFESNLKKISKQIGELGSALGLYAEAQVRERIRELFKARGIHIPSVTYHYQMEDGKGEFLYEIDILLYDTEYTIAIEVKHHLKKDDVDEHLERLEKCSKVPPRGTNGKQMLGAVATMILSAEVEQYAKRKGLYVLKPSGETVKIANAKDFKPRVWELAD